jgi:hypothetical protein
LAVQLLQQVAAVDDLARSQQQSAFRIPQAERQRLVQAQVLCGESDQFHGGARPLACAAKDALTTYIGWHDRRLKQANQAKKKSGSRRTR